MFTVLRWTLYLQLMIKDELQKNLYRQQEFIIIHGILNHFCNKSWTQQLKLFAKLINICIQLIKEIVKCIWEDRKQHKIFSVFLFKTWDIGIGGVRQLLSRKKYTNSSFSKRLTKDDYNIDRTLRALWLVKNLCFTRV